MMSDKNSQSKTPAQGAVHASNVSRDLLAGVVGALEDTSRRQGEFNHMLARYAGNACRLLGFSELEIRVRKLLQALTPRIYWAQTITNCDTTRMPDSAKELDSLEKIEQEYPVFPEDYSIVSLRQMEERLSICADRDYERAFAQADTELAKEEVLLAQVLMGDYGLAVGALSRLREQDRRQGVVLVAMIELYRKGRIPEAEVYRTWLTPGSLAGWDGVQLALGACNRIPWGIYPFPDY